MTSEILLLPVDAPVPEEVLETPIVDHETPDDAIPVKRGRGRPPGAKNRPKTTNVEPVETKRTKRPPPPPQEESEDDEPPTPPPVKRKPKKRPPPPSESEEDDEREPSPREKHRQAQADVLTKRRNHHQERVQNYSTLLDHMLAY